MRIWNGLGLGLTLVAAPTVGHSVTLEVEAHWVGGFFADGGKMNDFGHQNYFVGYGTTPGFGRTAERRSFFWFDIPEFEGTIVSASVELKLLFSTSLIFGASEADPTIKDPFETFRMGAIPHSPHGLVAPGLSSADVMSIFGVMDDTPISIPKTFMFDDPPPFPSDHDIEIDELGKSFIMAKRGSELVLTGWMPTWSYDSRTGPTGSFLEGSELIWGFSDITGPSGALVPKPKLTITYTPVPEPATMTSICLGVAALLRARKAKR